jgi:lysozyme
MRVTLLILFSVFINIKQTNTYTVFNKVILSNIDRKENKTVYEGIDISKYQTNINWDKLRDIDFVICKKSEGITLTDSKFEQHFNNIPCLKGAYHFFRPQYSGIEQAKFFLSNLDTSKLDIKPVIDIEWSKWWDNSNKKIGVQRLSDMINYIESEIGCKPIIYTSPKFWNKYIHNEIELKDVNLWVADWRNDSIPEIPCGFNDWDIWQKSSQHKIEGISGYVDYNISKNIDSILLNN